MYNALNGIPTGQDCLVTGLTTQGMQLRANCLRLDRHAAVFEVFTPEAVLRASEVLTEFKIAIDGQAAYAGRAVMKSVISSSTSLLCEATLSDSWIDLEPEAAESAAGKLRSEFARFLRTSSNGFKVLPEFKLVVADMQAFLLDLRQWLDQVEFGVRSHHAE